MSEELGKHKGAVETLLHEKKELSRLLQIVNSQLQRHLSALEDSGVDTDQFIQELQQEGQKKAEQQRKRQEQNRGRSSGKQDSGRTRQRNRSDSQRSSGQQNDKEEEFDLGSHLE